MTFRDEARWRLFGYRWFEHSPLFCFVHPFRAAAALRRTHRNADLYQGHLSAAWARLGKPVGRAAMDEEIGIKW